MNTDAPASVVMYPVGFRHYSGVELKGDHAMGHIARYLQGVYGEGHSRRAVYAGEATLDDGVRYHAIACDTDSLGLSCAAVLRGVGHPDDKSKVRALRLSDGAVLEHSHGAVVASRMVAGKPALRIREDIAPSHGTFPLNLGDNEVRAMGDVGDQDRWNNAHISATQDKVNKIRARILQARAPGNQGAEQLPAVGSDNKPPPTSGQNNWPSLQMPDGMR